MNSAACLGQGFFALRTRFAPSPTGFLHLGHALSAFTVWQAAEAAGGEVLLRLEDIDQTRCRPEFEGALLEDLAWLSLSCPQPVRRQSDHFADYQDVIDRLGARGLLYRCFRTRSELAPLGTAPFAGQALAPQEEAVRLQRGDAFAWRLSLSAARAALGRRYDALSFQEDMGHAVITHPAEPGRLGDVVLARKDTPASYHLACTHDDALQGVTHVIRGEDLREATHIHVLLQALMDWPVPVYRFHPLIEAPDGRKLAKRAGDKPLRDYRKEGVTAADIRRMTGFA